LPTEVSERSRTPIREQNTRTVSISSPRRQRRLGPLNQRPVAVLELLP
jgi:hypothetical protein